MPPAQPAAAGGSVLQIGAYKSQADADAAWKTYKAKHAALLAGYSPDVQQVDLGEKGTWYRLRIGACPTRSARIGAVRPAEGRRRRLHSGEMIWRHTIDAMRTRAIYGCAGTVRRRRERAFLSRGAALGLHPLRAQHSATAIKSAAWLQHLRETVDDSQAPVLIDQEGGRVARLKPPHWRERPPAARFGALYANHPEGGREATYLNARLIAHDLAEPGHQCRLPAGAGCAGSGRP